jgi:hypothetical protein
MRAFRRRLASFALALTALQLAVLLAAPLSACCTPKATASAIATIEKGDCCPAGSHAPGECPLHKNDKSAARQTSRGTQCRMLCDAAHGPQFMFAAIGVLPSPAVSPIAFDASALVAHAILAPPSSAPLTAAPPPKLL